MSINTSSTQLAWIAFRTACSTSSSSIPCRRSLSEISMDIILLRFTALLADGVDYHDHDAVREWLQDYSSHCGHERS